ncbi:hypothetical protein [Streptomyces sp. NK15101]|uniref:hypothetical protein n=1 Tax=Streptomyces sp. NK15101 TaxID=2873261 RepID=UPI001CED035B|nr:hypothetical protein [Streptomyces sp. NK15101]
MLTSRSRSRRAPFGGLPGVHGDREGAGFEFVRRDAVGGAFPEPLTVGTGSFDPREAG